MPASRFKVRSTLPRAILILLCGAHLLVIHCIGREHITLDFHIVGPTDLSGFILHIYKF